MMPKSTIGILENRSPVLGRLFIFIIIVAIVQAI